MGEQWSRQRGRELRESKACIPESSLPRREGLLTRTSKLKWLGCVKMLERKRFEKIAGIPSGVWWDFCELFMPRRLVQTGRFNFGVLV